MSVATPVDLEALFDQLATMEGKGELIDGEIVPMAATGPWPGYAGDEIYSSLRLYAKRTKTGVAVSDNKIFRMNLPRRQSFSPDAAYHVGTSRPMKYYDGAPVFAVEVRSSGDYGPRAEREPAEKRAEYFAAGTLVVWDIDLLSPEVVKSDRPESPETPTICRPDDIANAEPAVPGWTMPVNDLLSEGWTPPESLSNRADKSDRVEGCRMTVELLWVDPRTLRLPPERMQGADPTKFQRQLSQFGRSLEGMPPLVVYRTDDGELLIWNGATRAVQAAKLRPGELILAEVMGTHRICGKRLPLVKDRLP